MFQLSQKTFTAILFLSIVINSGCQSPPDKIKHELSDTTLADIALQSGDMRSAIGIYQKLLTEENKFVVKSLVNFWFLLSLARANHIPSSYISGCGMPLPGERDILIVRHRISGNRLSSINDQ